MGTDWPPRTCAAQTIPVLLNKEVASVMDVSPNAFLLAHLPGAAEMTSSGVLAMYWGLALSACSRCCSLSSRAAGSGRWIERRRPMITNLYEHGGVGDRIEAKVPTCGSDRACIGSCMPSSGKCAAVNAQPRDNARTC